MSVSILAIQGLSVSYKALPQQGKAQLSHPVTVGLALKGQ